MKTIPFSDLAKSDVCVFDIIAMHQRGQTLKEFHYVQFPRPNSGLIYVLSGDIVYSLCDKSELRAKTGDILYLPQGSFYSVKFESEKTKTMLVNFNLRDKNSEIIILSSNIAFCKKSKETESLISEICDIYTNKVENKLLLKEKLCHLLNMLTSEMSEKTPILKALDYINNNLTNNFKISELARISAMSESTFRREFKKETGFSPIKYINREKLKKAKQLLFFSDLSVGEIALNLGFFDAAHFCKAFKSEYNIYPIQCKKEFFE